MRRRQLGQLLTMLRDELSISSEPAVGVSATPNLKQVLTRHYETLYGEYDWPFLRRMFDRITLNAGQRYYDLPEDLDLEDLEEVKCWWSNLPHTITRGIGFNEYAVYSSDDDIRADPVQRWDVRDINGNEMIEVWPMPAGAGQSLQFKGRIKFRRLVDEADLCLLDDQLVVLHAAAELSPPKKRTDINAKLVAAQRRLGVLKARGQGGAATFRVGLGGEPKSHHGLTIRVR
jgi:hypothetical protein